MYWISESGLTPGARRRACECGPELVRVLVDVLNELWVNRKRDVRRDYQLMVAEAAANSLLREIMQAGEGEG